ncbi:MAG: hypothetical protein P8Y62_02125 [candidate division WOR-3 bacterium]
MEINKDFSLIESAFASLEGDGISYKGTFISPETFKNRNPQKIGELIEETALILEERTRRIEFEEWEETGEDMPYNTLHNGIQKIRELGGIIKNSEKIESCDHDWKLIGELIRIIASLLNHINKTR